MIQGRIIVTMVNIYFLVGCAAVPQASCPVGEKRSVNELVYFGTAKPEGTVTSKEWSEFLRMSVTPRFPRGFTVWEASGQWQGTDGIVAHESSYVLSLVHPNDDRSENAVQTIATEYKSRFNQETVLRVKSYACVSF